MYEEFLANRLTQLRTQANVSARSMSLELGQNAGYINHIENKQTLPSLDGFFKICKYLNITPGEFFDDGKNNPKLVSQINLELQQIDDDHLNHLYEILKIVEKKKES